MSSLVLFTLNRLDGIPRTTPVLQVLILAAGLLTARTLMLLLDDDRQATQPSNHSSVEHIIMIGSTRLSSLYIRFLRSYSPDQFRIIASARPRKSIHRTRNLRRTSRLAHPAP